MIVHASISENGNAGWDGKAKAGDQSGREVCTRTWYNKGWNVVLRHNDINIAKKAVELAVMLADSNLVGYDQSERNTLYKALKACKFDVDAYIRSGKKTETDCSAFVYAVYACLIKSMRYDGNAPTTRTMRAMFKKHGFTELKDVKYRITDKNLRAGDIMLLEGHHVAMEVTDHEPEHTVSTFYPSYTGQSGSIVDALAAVGEKDTSLTHRRRLAVTNGIDPSDSYKMNIELLKKLKKGMLIKR